MMGYRVENGEKDDSASDSGMVDSTVANGFLFSDGGIDDRKLRFNSPIILN